MCLCLGNTTLKIRQWMIDNDTYRARARQGSCVIRMTVRRNGGSSSVGCATRKTPLPYPAISRKRRGEQQCIKMARFTRSSAAWLLVTVQPATVAFGFMVSGNVTPFFTAVISAKSQWRSPAAFCCRFWPDRPRRRAFHLRQIKIRQPLALRHCSSSH